MALLSAIRRWAFRDGMSIWEITRRTRLSRSTIRKYLRSAALEPKLEAADRPSKLDPFADRLSGWLKTEAGKSRKQRCTGKQVHTDLVMLGLEPGKPIRIGSSVRAMQDDDPQSVCSGLPTVPPQNGFTNIWPRTIPQTNR